MTIWHDISAERITPDDFIAVVEISKGSKNKYELDKETGLLILDRVLYTSTHYPANYGFIPRTYAEDNDPLDVLILSSESIRPLAMCRCYPIGMITMLDEGYNDHKIIAIPFREPSWSEHESIEDLPKHIMEEIAHFFTIYKSLEGKETAVVKIEDAKAAKKVIKESVDAYRKRYLPHSQGR